MRKEKNSFLDTLKQKCKRKEVSITFQCRPMDAYSQPAFSCAWPSLLFHRSANNASSSTTFGSRQSSQPRLARGSIRFSFRSSLRSSRVNARSSKYDGNISSDHTRIAQLSRWTPFLLSTSGLMTFHLWFISFSFELTTSSQNSNFRKISFFCTTFMPLALR